MNITLIFDQFANRNQPFWFSFYNRLKEQPNISVKVLAASRSSNLSVSVLPLKSRTYKDKIIAGCRYYFNHRKAHFVTLKEFVRYPELCMDDNEIIHILNAQHYPSYRACIKNDKKLIFSFRGYDTLVRPLMDEKWRETLQVIYRDASMLHFVSHHISNKALNLGADPEKCKVIYRSVDLDYFKPNIAYCSKAKPPRIITIGRLTWQKGYSYALESIRNLQDLGYDVHYHIIGEGSDLQQLNFHRERLDLTNKVHFHGFQDRNQIREALDNASIYFHPAVSDAMPNSVLEASAMALPIVATDAGGIPEAVINLKTGLLAPITDVEELTKQLVFLLENSKEAKEMGLAGRLHIEERFGQTREMEEWVKIYEQLV